MSFETSNWQQADDVTRSSSSPKTGTTHAEGKDCRSYSTGNTLDLSKENHRKRPKPPAKSPRISKPAFATKELFELANLLEKRVAGNHLISRITGMTTYNATIRNTETTVILSETGVFVYVQNAASRAWSSCGYGKHFSNIAEAIVNYKSAPMKAFLQYIKAEQESIKAEQEPANVIQFLTETPLQILHSCGLHPGYYDTLSKAANGVRELVRDLRAKIADPPHDIQCAVLKKLGVEGFTADEPPTCKIIPITEQ